MLIKEKKSVDIFMGQGSNIVGEEIYQEFIRAEFPSRPHPRRSSVDDDDDGMKNGILNWKSD